MKINLMEISKISMIFLIGFLCANLINSYFIYGLEIPLFKDLGFSNHNYSNDAPFDFIKKNQIEVYSDRIVINVKDASISEYAPTGSMKPILDENSNGIRIIPKSEEDIHIGDMISFEQNNELIIHRVVYKGKDENGTYFITKGDNNLINDEKIRFKDIRYITIGIIY